MSREETALRLSKANLDELCRIFTNTDAASSSQSGKHALLAKSTSHSKRQRLKDSSAKQDFTSNFYHEFSIHRSFPISTLANDGQDQLEYDIALAQFASVVFDGVDHVSTSPIVLDTSHSEQLTFTQASVQALTIWTIGEDHLLQLLRLVDHRASSYNAQLKASRPKATEHAFVLELVVDIFISINDIQYGSDEMAALVKLAFPPPTHLKADPTWLYSQVSKRTLADADDIQSVRLLTPLFPYQRRAVSWMLNREQRKDTSTSMPPFWEAMTLTSGAQVYINRLFSQLQLDRSSVPAFDISGGLLAEEMGLGKTIEMLALVLLNPFDSTRSLEWQLPTTADSEFAPVPIKATLIITPAVILNQWVQEVETHSPHLKVFIYDGVPRGAHSMDDSVEVEDVQDCDIVLSTYDILSRELAFSRTIKERSRRHERKYIPRRSCLVKCLWWRVCLDEVQMAESTTSNIAEMARLIPRINSWGVSGTPTKGALDDLFGLLNFLHLYPIAQNKPLWRQVVSQPHILLSLFQKIMCRNTKAQIKGELTLPTQHQFAVPVELSDIEQHNYDEQFRRALTGLKLDETGKPTDNHWQLDAETARTWLLRLRMTCSHPQVGTLNQNVLGQSLKTVTEMLDVMYDNQSMRIFTDELQGYNLMIRRGQLHLIGDERDDDMAFAIFSDCLPQVQNRLDKLRSILNEHKKLKPHKDSSRSQSDKHERASENSFIEDSDTDSYTYGLSEEMKAWTTKHQSLTTRVTEWTTMVHRLHFLIGDIQFRKHQRILGWKEGDEAIVEDASTKIPEDRKAEYEQFKLSEKEHFDIAEQIRRQLLKETLNKSNHAIAKLRHNVKMDWAGEEESIEVTFSKFQGGILSRRIFDQMDTVCELLNIQMEKLIEWRQVVFEMLVQKVSNEDAEADGEEYQRNLDIQEESAIYLEELRLMLGDRRAMLTGVRYTDTKKSPYDAQTGETEAEKVLAPKLVKERMAVRTGKHDGNVQSLYNEMRARLTETDIREEQSMLSQEIRRTKKILDHHKKLLEDFEKDQQLFGDVFNARIAYFKHLQRISDTVATIEHANPAREITRLEREEDGIMNKVANAVATQRYLAHLLKKHNDGEEDRQCVICQSEILQGAITACSHLFCWDCLNQWFVLSHKRQCPVCKSTLTKDAYHKVVWKKREVTPIKEEEDDVKMGRAEDQQPDTKVSKVAESNPANSQMSPDILDEIKATKLEGSFGSKLDLMIKHLLYINEKSPHTKSIVFSQWAHSLDILGIGLEKNGIGYVRIDGKERKEAIRRFREEFGIKVFMLHGKSQSAGLTLVAATNVFLCEPMVNMALEKQAINRVHRIGQTKETSVYQYYAADTVEWRILELTRQQRRRGVDGEENSDEEHLATDVGSAMAGRRSNGKASSGSRSTWRGALQMSDQGEMVKDADLWRCFFENDLRMEPVMEPSAEQKRDLERQRRLAAIEMRLGRS